MCSYVKRVRYTEAKGTLRRSAIPEGIKQVNAQFQLRVFYSVGATAWLLVINTHVPRPKVAYSILRCKKPRDDFGHILDVLQIDKFFLTMYIALRPYHTKGKWKLQCLLKMESLLWGRVLLDVL